MLTSAVSGGCGPAELMERGQRLLQLRGKLVAGCESVHDNPQTSWEYIIPRVTQGVCYGADIGHSSNIVGEAEGAHRRPIGYSASSGSVEMK